MSSRSEPVMSARQAAELDHGMGRNNWASKDAKLLSTGDNLSVIKPVLYGVSQVVPIPHVIDMDADPIIPDELQAGGWTVKEHIPGGQLDWWNIKLDFSQPGWQDREMSIPEFWTALRQHQEPVLNANLLDYLLAHPELVLWELDGWRRTKHPCANMISFWGTVYETPDGELTVRTLCESTLGPGLAGSFLEPGSKWAVSVYRPIRLVNQ